MWGLITCKRRWVRRRILHCASSFEPIRLVSGSSVIFRYEIIILNEKRQQKNRFISDCLAVLVEIKRLTNQKNSEIARSLGIDPRTIWALEAQKSASRQLLAGLELLKELTIYRAKEAEQNKTPTRTAETKFQMKTQRWCKHIIRKEYQPDWSWTDGKGWVFRGVSTAHPLYDWVILNSWKLCPICGVKRPKR